MTEQAQPYFSKCQCQCCGGHMEFDMMHVGEIAECPHCGQETKLDPLFDFEPIPDTGLSGTKMPPKSAAPPKPAPNAHEEHTYTKRRHVRELRRGTVYPNLRGVVTAAALLMVALGVMIMITGVSFLLGDEAQFFFGIVSGGIIATAAWVAREAIFVFIDMADATLNQSYRDELLNREQIRERGRTSTG